MFALLLANFQPRLLAAWSKASRNHCALDSLTTISGLPFLFNGLRMIANPAVFVRPYFEFAGLDAFLGGRRLVVRGNGVLWRLAGRFFSSACKKSACVFFQSGFKDSDAFVFSAVRQGLFFELAHPFAAEAHPCACVSQREGTSFFQSVP